MSIKTNESVDKLMFAMLFLGIAELIVGCSWLDVDSDEDVVEKSKGSREVGRPVLMFP